MALARACSVAVPINPRLTPAEIEFIAADCALDTIIVSDDFVGAARALATMPSVISIAGDVGETIRSSSSAYPT